MRATPLSVTHPTLAAQALGWDPSTTSGGCNEKRNWRCDAGHEWDAIVANRARLGRGCPYCSGRLPIVGVSDLATTHPDIAAQAVGWDPTTVMDGTNAKRRWRCGLGHEWETTVASRTQGNGCPFCSGRRATPGVNDLATTNPELAAQAVGWDPTTVKAYSDQKRLWRCDVGHEWVALVSSRSAGNGCPYCAGHKVLAGYNDLATTDPELAVQACGWDPTTVSRGAHVMRRWRCGIGHEWDAIVMNRATKSQGCPICSGHQVLVGFNDLATTDPLIAAQAFEWDPSTLTRWSNKRVRWRCSLGHTWSVNVAGRTRGSGCPVCASKVVLVGFNDLAHTHPAIAAQAWGWDPTTVTHGSDKRFLWHCELGHEWRTSVANRVGGKDCPTCASHGFDGNKPAWLYLMEHVGHDLLQIGITNVPSSRVKTHESRGWTIARAGGSDGGP